MSRWRVKETVGVCSSDAADSKLGVKTNAGGRFADRTAANALMETIANRQWTDEKGECYEIHYSAPGSWNCVRWGSGWSKSFPIWLDKDIDRVWWGSWSYYFDLADLPTNPSRIAWHKTRAAQIAYVWTSRRAKESAAKVEERSARRACASHADEKSQLPQQKRAELCFDIPKGFRPPPGLEAPPGLEHLTQDGAASNLARGREINRNMDMDARMNRKTCVPPPCASAAYASAISVEEDVGGGSPRRGSDASCDDGDTSLGSHHSWHYYESSDHDDTDDDVSWRKSSKDNESYAHGRAHASANDWAWRPQLWR
eukprot:TRINITY_DN22784_c0_g1_i1.p1 TRINITY_DN22784_c0_g1~~TRINITY_DN22784_c0_g1_i1.p1  ORF type:complete len:313 (-),score=50.15 TRINITY_DN22784_c0_g1_i1:461-1399(-)